jgi:hypothetical protein
MSYERILERQMRVRRRLVITFAAALLYPLGLVKLRMGPLGSLASVGWTGVVFLSVLALPFGWLLRTLRDPSWREGADQSSTMTAPVGHETEPWNATGSHRTVCRHRA